MTPNGNTAPGSHVWSSFCGGRGQTNLQKDRRDDNIHLTLITAWAGRVKWTRVVNASYFTRVSVCPLFVLRQVSDLVLIDPIPEDVFEEDLWKEYWWVYSCFQGLRKDRTGKREEKGGGVRKEKKKRGGMWKSGLEKKIEKRSTWKGAKRDDKELWGAGRSR